MFKDIIKKENSNQKTRSSGVAVLFAVLVAVILVSIGATIVSIALRQTILSSTGRESQVAFYVASTAIECARYWDVNGLDTNDGIQYVFPNSASSPTQTFIENGNRDDITCDEFKIITDPRSNWVQVEENTAFDIFINNSQTGQEYCASVEVLKSYNSAEEKNETVIRSRGYNVATCSPTSARAVERGLEMYYTN